MRSAKSHFDSMRLQRPKFRILPGVSTGFISAANYFKFHGTEVESMQEGVVLSDADTLPKLLLLLVLYPHSATSNTRTTTTLPTVEHSRIPHFPLGWYWTTFSMLPILTLYPYLTLPLSGFGYPGMQFADCLKFLGNFSLCSIFWHHPTPTP